MPKAPKNKSGLREVRRATGLNQSDFARKIGCPFSTLQSLELGKMKLSPQVAQRVYFVTGCELKWENKTKPAVVAKDWNGKEYSRDSYRQWDQWCRKASKRGVPRKKELVRMLADAICE